MIKPFRNHQEITHKIIKLVLTNFTWENDKEFFQTLVVSAEDQQALEENVLYWQNCFEEFKALDNKCFEAFERYNYLKTKLEFNPLYTHCKNND